MTDPKPKPKDEPDAVTEFKDEKTDEEILEYWTDERKAKAKSVPMPRPNRRGGDATPQEGE